MDFLNSDGARTGLYFGATSGVITTLGLLTGLYAGTGAATAVPLLLMPLRTAVIASVVWGMSVITVLSYFLAKSAQERPLPIILEHLGIAMLVVLLSHLIGPWVGANFD